MTDGRCPRCHRRYAGLDDLTLVLVDPDQSPRIANLAIYCWRCAQAHEVETGQINPGDPPIAAGRPEEQT